MEASSNHSDSPLLVLPDHRMLSPASLLLLETHFRTDQDLSAASDLVAALTESCSNSESNLAALHRKLTTIAVSWISRSFAAKSSIRGLTFDLQNLSLHTSRYVINKKIQNILGKDLPHLMKQVGWIETILEYAEKTRQLEALVGDLEDAVLCVVKQNAREMFSKCVVNPSNSIDFGRKLEQLLQVVKLMNDIEDVLVCIAKSTPQWRHLLKSVDARVNNAFVLLRPQALSDHRAILSSLGWPPKLAQIEVREIRGLPNPLLLMQGEGRKSYSLSFQTLCALQHLQMRREERKPKNGGKEEQNISLWAIDELVSPIASRTEHHFLKWAEQPELMFALVHKITQEFVVEVDNVLQPLIDKARLLSCSAKEAWVSSMVKMLSTFLVNKVFSVLSERYKTEKHMKSEVISSWLNLIDLIVAFDKQMQLLLNSETGFFLLDTVEEFPKCMSVLSIFCDRPKWLKIWAKMELKDSWKKLKLELDDERTWLICTKQGSEFHFKTETQFLLSNREDYKAPPIADSALKFAWGMVERCRTMASTLSQIQFIRATASRFFLYFFKSLVAHGKRVEPTATNPEDDALIGVCGLINAARYCEAKLLEWSDDAYFLELRLAESGTGGQSKISDHYSCFFWEEIKTFTELETQWLMELVSDVLYQFDILSLTYFQTLGSVQQVQWEFSPANVSSAIEVAVSADFAVALDTLRNRLCAIEMNLNQKDFLDLWRSIADGLDHFVSSKVTASDVRLSNERLSQFCADMEALFSVFGSFCVRPGAFFPGIRASLKL